MASFKGKYFTFIGKKYALNLTALKKVCLTSSAEGNTKECEISQVYEVLENGDFDLTSKVEHETKVLGNPQNNMIIYDIVKLLLATILEHSDVEVDFNLDLGLSISLNTLISWGVLEEIKG